MRETVVNTMTSLERKINKWKEKLSLLSLNMLSFLHTKFGDNNNFILTIIDVSTTKINTTTTRTKTTTTQEIVQIPNTKDT